MRNGPRAAWAMRHSRKDGLPALRFIEAARDFLTENDGATAEDPGYFDD